MSNYQAAIVEPVMQTNFIVNLNSARANGDYKALASIIRYTVDFSRGFTRLVENEQAKVHFE